MDSGVLDGQPFEHRSVEVSHIRRIAARGDETFWVVFLDDEGALRKASEVRFAAGAHLKFRAAGSTSQPEHSLAAIKDYTCSLACY